MDVPESSGSLIRQFAAEKGLCNLCLRSIAFARSKRRYKTLISRTWAIIAAAPIT
jgi:hypothetical protein